MRIMLGKFRLEDEKVRSEWGQRPFSAGLDFRGRGKHDQYQVELPRPNHWTAEELFHWVAGEVMEYRIFPPSRMEALVDGPRGRVVEGGTVLQGVLVGPFRLRMADRVLDVFDGENEQERWTGFTYGTLEGHAEKGIETFKVTWQKGSGRVQFTMEAWSKPGHWLVRLFYPWARAVQRKAGREAMEFMRARLQAVEKGQEKQVVP